MIEHFFMKPEVRGELMERVLLNAARLCSGIYRPNAIYTQDKNGWPGDWEGRTILALVSHMKALEREPAYLREIIRDIPEHLNEKGYLGKVLPDGVFDEQQLSGHNWLLSGLVEYEYLSGDENVLQMIKSIVSNLYLPLTGYYKTYPLDPEIRKTGGSYSGTVSSRVGSWILSTDIGCAFMCLDGLSRYYELFRDKKVLRLLSEMISVFKKIDFVGTHMQTHATLSAVRGILKLYKVTSKKEYLDVAESVFELYKTCGMTENYANFNWFGRFDTWTEPCAITDSLIVATDLYKLTGKISYLKLAARIYYNAFCYAQRYNGGFGTDKTVGPAGKYLSPAGPGISEAYWCCTMRGAEGLAYLCENSALVKKNYDVIVPFGGSFTVHSMEYRLDFESRIPYEDTFDVKVLALEDVSFKILVLGEEDLVEFHVNAKKGAKFHLSGKISISHHDESAFTVDGKKHFYGNLLLGTPNLTLNREGVSNDENALRPLTDMKDVMPENIKGEGRQIVF